MATPVASIIRRHIAREIYGATLFVSVAFLCLFAFFDLINEMGEVGRGQYRLQHAILFVLLSAPSHIYELAPIAVLIGTLYALSQLAANSEYAVMRGSGLSPLKAAVMLFRIGIVFVVITSLFGELIAPLAERAAREFKLSTTSSVVAQEFRSGLWVKDEMRFVNVREVRPDSGLSGIRIYEFDADHRLQTISFAESGRYTAEHLWLLTNVVQTRFSESETSIVRIQEFQWKSVLTPDILAVLFVVPERMSAWTLYQYTRHLADNQQKTERYKIALWKKIIYPFAVLVMMGLALPFAYIHTRAGGVGLKVFSGIMLGILFHMLNSLFSHLGLLQNWQPLLAALMPSAVFLMAAAAMMWWVDRR